MNLYPYCNGEKTSVVFFSKRLFHLTRLFLGLLYRYIKKNLFSLSSWHFGIKCFGVRESYELESLTLTTKIKRISRSKRSSFSVYCFYGDPLKTLNKSFYIRSDVIRQFCVRVERGHRCRCKCVDVSLTVTKFIWSPESKIILVTWSD